MAHFPKTAQYLLRFDDLCPTMNGRVWAAIERALLAHRLNPILAVVPDNRDPLLQVDPPAPDFWDRVREWQARDWAIAIHGFQHRYLTRHAGLVTRPKKTEFAGILPEIQAEALQRALAIFERERIRPRLWVAPNNSFDAVTVSLLAKFGIRLICDGNFRFPFEDPNRVTWLPQQLFSFRPAPRGVWTVCYHHNHWTESNLRRFDADLERYAPQIRSLETVLEEWENGPAGWSARLYRRPRLSFFVIHCQLKAWTWRRALRARWSGLPQPGAVSRATTLSLSK